MIAGYWNDNDCNERFHFLCKRPLGAATSFTPPTTPLIAGGCPQGFSGVNYGRETVITLFMLYIVILIYHITVQSWNSLGLIFLYKDDHRKLTSLTTITTTTTTTTETTTTTTTTTLLPIFNIIN